MKLTITTTHELTFTVAAFWSEEGGMGYERFGSNVKTLEEAVALLGQARASTAGLKQDATNDWKIIVDVTTKTTS